MLSYLLSDWKQKTDWQYTLLTQYSTLLLVAPNGREHKTNINDVKPCTTLELIKNAWNSFLNPKKIKCQNHDYNLGPHD